MDLRQYLSVPVRRYKEIIAITVLFMIISLALTSFKQNSYPVTLFYTIALDDKQDTENYKYSNFYAEQSGLEFTRTVSGWFDDPALEGEVFANAGINKDDELTLIKKLFGFFTMKRVERQNIQVNFSTSADERSHKLADALGEVIKARLVDYNEGSSSNYKMVLSSKWVELKEPSYPLSAVLSFFIGLILGIFLSYLYEYFTRKISTIFEAEEISGKKILGEIKRDKLSVAFLEKLISTHKPEQIVFVSQDRKILDGKVLVFPSDLKLIDANKKSFVIVSLGVSREDHLHKVSKLIDGDKLFLVVLT